MSYTMRRATLTDLDAVMRLLDERISWLAEHGSDQWSTRDFRPVMTDAITHGETWLLLDQDEPVATITLTSIGDPDFWTAEELEVPALYVSKLATALSHRGQGLGRLLLEWANNYAADRDVSTLRWDVWRTNQALQDYYAGIGLHPLRTAEVPGRWSGVLYEVAFKAPTDLSDINAETSHGPLLILPSRITTPMSLGLGLGDLDPYDNAPPSHSHTLTGLRVSSQGSPIPWPDRELMIPGDDTQRALLYNAGAGWRIRNLVSQAVTTWTDQPDLQPGQLYHLCHQTLTDNECRVAISADRSEANADRTSALLY